MKKILAFLSQPAPASRKPWMITIVVTAVVFFMLLLLIHTPDNALRWKVLIGFSSVTGIITLIWGYVFPRLFKRFYAISTWTIWKMLVNNAIIILMISIGNVILDFFLFERKPEMFLELFTSYILITFLIGLMPATIASLIVWNHQLKYNLQHSSEINSRLSSVEENNQPAQQKDLPEKILLKGNTKETVEIRPDDLLYIESSGNYLLINYYSGERNIRQKQLRNTFSNIEQALSTCPRIVRCHRGFMVNLSYITSAEGNAQGMQLKLTDVSHTIPVSRNYLSVIREGLMQ